MPIGNIDTASQGTLDSTFHVSVIEIRLASGSSKTIDSIKLFKKDKLLREVEKTIRAGESHQEKFTQPPTLDLSDRIRASVRCSSRWLKQIDVVIDVDLRDNKYMRNEGDKGCFYRKKIRNIEVVISAQQQPSLPGFTTQTIEDCPRFRLLVIGNSGVGKSTLIHRVFGVEGVKPSQNHRGEADIEAEFTSPTNDRFVVHDSLGFEAGDERHMNIVKEFVASRKAVPETKDQLHAIWLCLDIPYAGGRLLETGVESLLRRRKEILGDIPLVVVLTKVDLLDAHLEAELPKNMTLESYRSRYMKERCIERLRNAAGPDVTHVTVSCEEDYADSLRDLLRATMDKMAKYHVNEGPSTMAVIAQRISIKEKIELSIRMGKKKYWKTLLKSAVFRGHTLNECLQVIHDDIIAIWNFNDPHQCLMANDFIEALFYCADNFGETIDSDSSTRSPTTSSTNSPTFFEQLKSTLGSEDIMLLVPRGIAKIAFAVPDQMYQAYKEAKEDAKMLTAYIVNLICVMQIIFLLISGDRATPETVALALKTYEEPRKSVHQSVLDFDGKMGVLPGGSDYVLEKIEELIWRHSIADHQIKELRHKIPQAAPQGSAPVSS